MSSYKSKRRPVPITTAPTTVVNITTAPPGVRWQYIGRAFPRMKLQASKWANLHKIETDTDATRRAAISAFITRLYASGLFFHVAELKGQALGCFCHPKPCHGHALAKLANALQFHGAACPECRKPVKSSPMRKRELLQLAEFWKCNHCGAFGFEDRGAVDLLPEITEAPSPTLNLL